VRIPPQRPPERAIRQQDAVEGRPAANQPRQLLTQHGVVHQRVQARRQEEPRLHAVQRQEHKKKHKGNKQEVEENEQAVKKKKKRPRGRSQENQDFGAGQCGIHKNPPLISTFFPISGGSFLFLEENDYLFVPLVSLDLRDPVCRKSAVPRQQQRPIPEEGQTREKEKPMKELSLQKNARIKV
jgi:hypothetical protein